MNIECQDKMLRRSILVILLFLPLSVSFTFKLENDVETLQEIFPTPKGKTTEIRNSSLINIRRSKVEVLGEVLKNGVDALRKRPDKSVDLLFLVDSSASVGAENFFNELKFVKKLLADFTVAFNNTRVAVVTFSSKTKVVRHIDHLTNASEENHKCRLLDQQLPMIKYSGGGTFTLGALLEAKRILGSARPKAAKAVFLITDGYSNGGDPRPAAKDLRQAGVQMFTFGIRNGNVRELFDMASEPQQNHSFILDSFEEFEALARRALHEDLNIGTFQPQEMDACKGLCIGGSECCDSGAQCTCGIHTGHYACVCPKGFYGTGLNGDCHPCPVGTYRDELGPGNIGSCTPCPDMNHYSSQGSGSISDCHCKLGYRNIGDKCKVIECPKMRPPPNAHFVRYGCYNVFNAACGIRCNPGYRLEGSSIRLCGENGEWSGDNATCVVKTCPALKNPKNGAMTCDNDVFQFETECNFTCNPGFALVGSKSRYCLAIALWDGLPSHCRPIFCQPLAPLVHGSISVPKCISHKSQYGEVCNYTCNDGYEVNGPKQRTCIDPGVWSDGDKKTHCTDVTPPIITCPQDIEVDGEDGDNGALVTWELPVATDNSLQEIPLTASPAVVSPSKFKIGISVVTYIAEDKQQNRAQCNFTISVRDTQAPTVDQCNSPATFLLRDPSVEVTWEEPIFSDNSGGFVRIERSRGPGTFPYGETSVVYTAWDESGNNSTCTIKIVVQEHACAMPVDPVHGHTNCSTNPSGVLCSLTCQEGYAFAIRPATNYFCAYDGMWIPSENLPFPDCSVTLLPTDVLHNGLITLHSEDVPCEDQFFLSQVENRMQKKVSGKIAQYCVENSVCDVEDMTAICGFQLLGMDDPSNANLLKRRRRRRSLPMSDSIITTESSNTFDNVSLLFRVKGQMRSGGNYSSFASEVTHALHRLRSAAEEGELDLHMGNRHLVYSVITVLEEKPLFVCDPGSVLRDDLCVKCPVGTFYNVVTEECQSCSRGSYQFHEGQLSCLVCPGRTSTSQGQAKSRADCKAQCLPGSFSSSGLEICETCARGFFQTDYASTKCVPCPDSTTTARRGARKPEDCRKLCRPGYVSETGLAPCFACPDGYYQEEAGQMSCYKCHNGLTTGLIGSSNVTDCDGWNETASESQEVEELLVNECFSVPCLNGGACQIHGFGYVCTCAPGFTGMICEKEINECDLEQCDNGGTCVDMIGAFKCNCPPGFQGDTCQENIDECASNPCHNGATCLDLDNSFTCKCANGFRGLLCDTDIDECASNPCQNNGTCIDQIAAFACNCTLGFLGKLCEVDVDECQSSPCMNGASCIDGIANFRCDCLKGFSGSLCSENIDDCSPFPCKNGATCVDLISAFTCVCPPTFSGKLCETELSPDFQLHFASGILDYSQTAGFPRPLSQFSACLWIKTSDKSNYGTPLSYANFTVDNIITLTDYNGFVFYVNGEEVITDVTVNDGRWHFICVTWNSSGGQWKIFLDGQVSDEGDALASGTSIPVDGVLVVGQEQDSRGGGFSAAESFVGSISHLNLWDKTLSPEEISKIGTSCTPYHGNLRAWPDFLGGLKGRIKVEESRFCKGCVPLNDPENGTVETNGLEMLAVANYKCHSGYSLSGNATRTCEVHGEWSGVVPQCKRVDCGFPGYLANGLIHGMKYSFGGTIEYSCNSGFLLVGEKNRTCLDTGLWSGKKPVCQELLCPQPKVPANGQIMSVLDYFRPFDELKFSCNAGYRLDGPATVTCLANAVWDEEMPVCQPVACSAPPRVDNGRVEGADKVTRVGDFVRIVCNVGYILVGLESGAMLTCGNDLMWQGDIPRCVPLDCGKPPSSLNAHVKYIETTYGKEVQYRCLTGYIFPEANNKTVRSMKCEKSGLWEGAVIQCNPVSCGPPPLIKHGEVRADANTFGANAQYSCMPGYVLSGPASRICQSTGKWSQEHPYCSRVRCPGTPHIANSKVEGPDGPWTPGVILKYSCSPGYSRNGSSHRTCLDNGNWSHDPPSCVLLKCHSPPTVSNGFLLTSVSEYFVGTKILYSCHTGFRMEGDGSLSCEAKGHWVGEVPTCLKVTCGPVDNLEQGSFIVESFTFQGTLTYSCGHGFRLINGSEVRTCSADGKWTGTSPRCQPVTCSNPKAPMHGKIRVAGVTLGAVATMECNPGYIMTGGSEIFCGSEGEWEGGNVSCMPVICPMPESPVNGKVNVNSGLGYQSTVRYECDVGYKAVGDTDMESECLQDGSWSDVTPDCVLVECPSPLASTFLHGRRHVHNLAVGAMMLFECDVGFRMVGERILICLNDSSWDNPEPICQRVSCPKPPSPSKGVVHGEGYQFGDVITYSCDKGHRIAGGSSSRTCLEDASWSGSSPSCEPISCPAPQKPDHGYVTVSDNLAQYSCDKGFRMDPEIPNHIKCSENGTWQPEIDIQISTPCQAISCTEPPAIANGTVTFDLLVGSFANYTCDEGFILKGEATLTCTSDGYWDVLAPECILVSCPGVSFTTLANGTVTGDLVNPVFLSVIQFSCNDGFDLIGDSMLECDSSGSWNGMWPSCVYHICSTPERPINGMISVLNDSITGLKVQYACEQGFVLQGDSILTCTTGSEWSGPSPICERILCYPPPKIQNSIHHVLTVDVEPDQSGMTYGFGDNVTYECLQGFVLEDESTLTCGYDGDWWPSEHPICQIALCTIPDISSSHISLQVISMNAGYLFIEHLEGDALLSTLPESDENITTFLYGTVISLECDEGYSFGEPEVLIWHCESDGNWNGSSTIPECFRVYCQTPVSPANGTVTMTEAAQYGDVAIYTCKEGYIGDDRSMSSVRKCQADGTWNGTQLSCQPIQCSTPDDIVHGFVSDGGDLSYGSMLTYDCELGYRLQGPGTRMCSGNGTWTGPEPFCMPVECSEPNPVLNGEIQVDLPLAGGTATYRCTPGFFLVGDAIRTCLLNGTWSKSAPSCVVIECPLLTDITNGHVKIPNMKRVIGSVATYTCDHGFKIQGSSQNRDCTDTGVWNGQEPECVRILCEDPPHLSNGWVHWDGVFVGATARYSCHVGYRAQGILTERTCNSDGRWSTGVVQCEKVTCLLPEAPGNGGRVLVDSVDYAKDSMQTFNTTVTFECSVQFQLVGAGTLRCGADGNWDNTPPICKRVFCNSPPWVHNALPVNEIEKLRIGSSVEYICRKGFQPFNVTSGTLKCGEDGQWVGEMPQCLPVYCGPPPKVTGTRLRHDTQTGQKRYTFESTVTYSCKDGLELEGDHTLFCDADGKWAGKTPSCSSTVCGPAPEAAHSTVQVESYDDHSMAHYRCQEGYRMMGGPQLTCRFAGIWDGGRCHSRCTVLLLGWYFRIQGSIMLMT